MRSSPPGASSSRRWRRWSGCPTTPPSRRGPRSCGPRSCATWDARRKAWPLYEALVERTDPAPGNELALTALAHRHGPGSEEAYGYLRRIWWAYPRSDASRETAELLAAYKRKPTWEEVGKRSEQLMWQGAYRDVVAATGARAEQATGKTLDSCRFWYVRGRSYYKLNQLTNAIGAFGDVLARCAEDPDDYGPKSLYLKGMAQFRKGRHETAAATFQLIPEHYPLSSYADDGLTHGGIALQEAGDLPGAQATWRRGLERFPEGDTVPESTFRLAWTHYLAGDADTAKAVAAELARLPLDADATHVVAGRYWKARWELFPDVTAPTTPSEAPGARERAVAGWTELCEQHPHSFYAILAYSRLLEEAPDVAAALAERPSYHRAGDQLQPWAIRVETHELEGLRSGADLVRLGLVQEGKAEWNEVDDLELSPDEMAWLIELRANSGDWLLAHDRMRRWMRDHPPGTLGDREPEILRLAYPDRYWAEVQEAVTYERYEPRLFHALVREESNFNRKIVSFAGARGLSQLMPTTAQQTAGWLGMKVTNAQLFDPTTNLKIGARYLDAMHKQFAGSPYLALAAYNAGGGRQNQWLGEWGNVPTDEYVERIPFRETRGYVKRVMGTWQTMRYQFDDGTAFPDLSAYNHQARPEDPTAGR